jgi:hypothetical protein
MTKQAPRKKVVPDFWESRRRAARDFLKAARDGLAISDDGDNGAPAMSSVILAAIAYPPANSSPTEPEPTNQPPLGLGTGPLVCPQAPGGRAGRSRVDIDIDRPIEAEYAQAGGRSFTVIVFKHASGDFDTAKHELLPGGNRIGEGVARSVASMASASSQQKQKPPPWSAIVASECHILTLCSEPSYALTSRPSSHADSRGYALLDSLVPRARPP